MNLFLKELKDNKKSFIFWSLGVAGFFLAGLSKYQGYASSGISIDDMFRDLPAAFGALFGLGSLDLNSIIGFYVIIVIYIAIMLGVNAVLLGANIFSKEETEKTAEFLFTKPISRSKIFMSKFLAALTLSVSLNFVSIILGIIIVNMFNNGASITKYILFLAPGVLLIQIMFLMVGILCAVIMKNSKRAGMVSASVLTGTFILSSFLDITGKYKFLIYLTPFKYFDAKELYLDNSYNISFLLISILFIILATIISKRYFTQKDFSA